MADYNRAWRLAGQQRLQDAISLLKQIIARDKTFYRAYAALAEVYDLGHDLDKAEEYFRSLLQKDHANGLAFYGLAETERRRQQMALAAEDYAHCINSQQSAHICYLPWVDALDELHPNSVMVSKLAREIPADPDQPYVYLMEVRAYEAAHRVGEARNAAELGLERAGRQGLTDLEAKFKLDLAGLDANLGADDKALAEAEEALRIYQQVGDVRGQWDARESVAVIRSRLGDDQTSLALYRENLELATDVGNPWVIYFSMLRLGSHYASHGDHDAAIRYYLEAEQQLDQIGTWKASDQACNLLLKIAGNYREEGDYENAIRYARESLDKSKSMGPGSEAYSQEAFALRTLGVLFADRGDYFKGLEYGVQSVQRFHELGKNWQAGAGEGNLADIYSAMGDQEKALHYLSRSLKSARDNRDWGEQQRILLNIGASYVTMNRPADALPYLRQALALWPKVRNVPFQTDILLNLGDAYRRQRNYAQALNYLHEALVTLQRQHMKPETAEALATLGDCHLDMENLSNAEDDFTQALQLAEPMELLEVVVEAQKGLGEVWGRRRSYSQGLEHFRSALQAAESLRARVPSPDLQLNYASQTAGVYEETIDLLARLHEQRGEQGYDREAFEYAEKARARSFLNMLSELQSRISNQLPLDQAHRESSLLAALSRASAALLKDDSQKNRVALKEAEGKLAEWKLQLRLNDPWYYALRYPEPYSASRAQTELTRNNTAILEYALGKRRSHLWLISATKVRMVNLPPQHVIGREVMAYRSLIAHRPKSVEDEAQFEKSARLYRLLLEPVSRDLVPGQKLVVVPDGILYYLPFETLVQAAHAAHGGAGRSRFLVEDYAISYAPSASVLGSLRNVYEGRKREAYSRQLLAYGDPVFPGVGAAQTAPGTEPLPKKADDVVRGAYEAAGVRFVSLPNTRAELNYIRDFFSPDQVATFYGRGATKTSFIAESNRPAARIHIATHSFVDERMPFLSGIVFSFGQWKQDDPILHMSEILNLRLKTDLLVLSACETGLGNIVTGEGMVGITRAFMYAGAPRLVVSLWPVSDLTTPEFMKGFYRSLGSGHSPIAALREAKLAMIHSDVPAYHQPYFWAPFVLVGLQQR